MLCMLALVDSGDEVLITSPRFTTYDNAVILCGGVPVPVPPAQREALEKGLRLAKVPVWTGGRDVLRQSARDHESVLGDESARLDVGRTRLEPPEYSIQLLDSVHVSAS